MTDTELTQQAKALDHQDWNGAYALSKQATSEEERKEIEQIAREYYHNEEYFADNL